MLVGAGNEEKIRSKFNFRYVVFLKKSRDHIDIGIKTTDKKKKWNYKITFSQIQKN